MSTSGPLVQEESQPYSAPALTSDRPSQQIVHRDGTSSAESYVDEKAHGKDPVTARQDVLLANDVEFEEAQARKRARYQKFRPFILGALGLLILGWWISATILKDTRHRWYVLTISIVKATD